MLLSRFFHCFIFSHFLALPATHVRGRAYALHPRSSLPQSLVSTLSPSAVLTHSKALAVSVAVASSPCPHYLGESTQSQCTSISPSSPLLGAFLLSGLRSQGGT